MKRLLAWVAVGLAVIYVGIGVLLYTSQTAMIFPAPRIPRAALDAAAERGGAVPFEVTTEDGVRLYGWHRPAAESRGVLLYFPGNAEAVMDRLDLHELAVSQGLDLVVVAYRGYPGSEGRPSEEGLYQDARAAWAYVTTELGVPPERIVVHGKSLGGGVAMGLLEEARPAALILESTFTSVPDVAAPSFPVFPVRLLVRHRFDSRTRAPALDLPVLVLHGSADGVIPVTHGRALAKAIPGARYVEVDGAGHGETLPAWDRAAREAWVETVASVE